MTGNRSLDEFAGTSGESDDELPADVDDRSADEAVVDAADADVDGTTTDAADLAVDAGDDDSAGSDVDADGAGGDPSDTAVEPVASTYAWSPDGGECAACGGTVEERWRDGGDLVCLDCKEW